MTLGSMNHLSLTVSNLKRAEERFYAPVLGFLGYEKVEDEHVMTLWFNATAGLAINLWQASDALSSVTHSRYAPGFHHVAFNAENRGQVDAMSRLLADKEITVLDAPAEYPQYATGYYAVFFADPDGLKFELVHMPTIPD